MIVIDASAFIDAVAGRQSVVERITGEVIYAPHLLDVEVTSGLRRLVSTGRLSEKRAAAAIEVLARADIERHPHRPLLPVIWSLRGRMSAYDATYVSLAAALGVPLVTTDQKLANVPGLPCDVEVPG